MTASLNRATHARWSYPPQTDRNPGGRVRLTPAGHLTCWVLAPLALGSIYRLAPGIAVIGGIGWLVAVVVYVHAVMVEAGGVLDALTDPAPGEFDDDAPDGWADR